MKTKHLTIMFTDIKGFTPRTSKLSRGELHKLLEMHDELIIPLFKKYKGRIVKTIGDAFMVTFHSPTDAVLCGIAIQKKLTKHNEKATEEDQLEVRVAINSGEVTLKGNDVFGEAVNIAARLEGLAEAGDIYFTEAVYLAMNKSEIPTAEVGQKHFKGVPEDIKVYKVLSETRKRKLFRRERQVIREKPTLKQKTWTFLKWAGIVFAAAVLLNIAGLGGLILIGIISVVIYYLALWLKEKKRVDFKKTSIKVLKWVGLIILALIILESFGLVGLLLAVLAVFIVIWYRERKEEKGK